MICNKMNNIGFDNQAFELKHNNDFNLQSNSFSIAAVQIDNVKKSYGDTEVLRGISLTVPMGCIYGLLGASGCGKTTLLSIMRDGHLVQPVPTLHPSKCHTYHCQLTAFCRCITASMTLEITQTYRELNALRVEPFQICSC